MSNFYPVFHICGNVIICGLCLSPSYVRTHIHMALVGVWGGCVKKEFGVEQLFSHAILRDPQRPSERLQGPQGRSGLWGGALNLLRPLPPLTRMFPVSFAMGIKVCLRFHLGKEFCWRWGVETIDVEKRVNLRVRARAPGHGPCPALTSQCVTLCRSLLFSGPWR